MLRYINVPYGDIPALRWSSRLDLWLWAPMPPPDNLYFLLMAPIIILEAMSHQTTQWQFMWQWKTFLHVFGFPIPHLHLQASNIIAAVLWSLYSLQRVRLRSQAEKRLRAPFKWANRDYNIQNTFQDIPGFLTLATWQPKAGGGWVRRFLCPPCL